MWFSLQWFPSNSILVDYVTHRSKVPILIGGFSVVCFNAKLALNSERHNKTEKRSTQNKEFVLELVHLFVRWFVHLSVFGIWNRIAGVVTLIWFSSLSPSDSNLISIFRFGQWNGLPWLTTRKIVLIVNTCYGSLFCIMLEPLNVFMLVPLLLLLSNFTSIFVFCFCFTFDFGFIFYSWNNV